MTDKTSTVVERRVRWYTSLIFLVISFFCFFVIHYMLWSVLFIILAGLSMAGFIAQEEYIEAEREGWVESKPKQKKKRNVGNSQ